MSGYIKPFVSAFLLTASGASLYVSPAFARLQQPRGQSDRDMMRGDWIAIGEDFEQAIDKATIEPTSHE